MTRIDCDGLPARLLDILTRFYLDEIVIATSFGLGSCLVIHEMCELVKAESINVVTVDTGYLHKETVHFRESFCNRYPRVDLHILRPTSHASPSSPDVCCRERKVHPMREFLTFKPYSAWVTGIRRDQTPDRNNVLREQWDPLFRLVKCNPIFDWTAQQVYQQCEARGVLFNPLCRKVGGSIGCHPCTDLDGGVAREKVRWPDVDKLECGLHSAKENPRQSGGL